MFKSLTLKNFRNFENIYIELKDKNIILGMNDVGKSNLLHSLRMIFSKNTVKDAARLSLARWYNKVDDSGFKSFNVIAATLYEHYDEVLNFFVNRATNAFAESFNAKIKAFRATLRGVTDIKFFLFRLTKLYA